MASQFRFSLAPEELDEVLEGNPFYKYKKFGVPSDIDLTRKDYATICEIAKKFRSKNPSFQAVYGGAPEVTDAE